MKSLNILKMETRKLEYRENDADNWEMYSYTTEKDWQQNLKVISKDHPHYHFRVVKENTTWEILDET